MYLSTSRSGVGGGGGWVFGGGGSLGSTPPPPPLKNNVKGFNPKYILFLESGVKIYRKCTIFLPQILFPGVGGMSPDPPSYGMSDVNPHLT